MLNVNRFIVKNKRKTFIQPLTSNWKCVLSTVNRPYSKLDFLFKLHLFIDWTIFFYFKISQNDIINRINLILSIFVAFVKVLEFFFVKVLEFSFFYIPLCFSLSLSLSLVHNVTKFLLSVRKLYFSISRYWTLLWKDSETAVEWMFNAF